MDKDQAVGLILGILAWIGWTMATTPPPAPIEEEVPSTAGEPGVPGERTTSPGSASPEEK